MATPTPSQNLAKAPQNAATPTSHPQLVAFSSPAPRSVASPAQLRHQQHAGRSPYNANASSRDLTGLGNNAASAAASAPSFKMPTSSPAAGMLNTESPAAMIYSLSALDNVIPLGLGMSGLGGTGASMRSRADDDEERRKRLVEVVSRLGRRPPRISIEGIEILAKRTALDTSLETDKKTGKRTVNVAGTTFLIEVHFDLENQVESVTLPFLGSDEATHEHNAEENAAIATLLFGILAPETTRSGRDLSFSPSQVNGDLAKFAQNLEYLGRLDKLSKQPGDATFDCFGAITGVYSSLKRLFEHEKAIALSLIDANKDRREARAEREVMCKKSGRPRLHERGRIGLRLDYWMQKRHVFIDHEEESRPNGDDVEMGGIDEPSKSSPQDLEDDIFSLLIECEAMDATAMGQPARITDSWLGDPIERALSDPDTTPEGSHPSPPQINWTNPPPSYTKPSTEQAQTDNFGLEAATGGMDKLPSIRFVAKLDPPIVVQYYVQPNMSSSDGLQNQYLAPTRTFAGLLLKPDIAEDFNSTLTDPSKEFARSRHVTYGVPSAPDGVVHENALWVSKPDVGKVISEIPFSHPQEIVQLLPKLRQYALLNQLLKQTFDGQGQIVSSAPLTNGVSLSRPIRNVHVDLCSMLEPKPRVAVSFGGLNHAQPSSLSNGLPTKNESSQMSLDDFLADADDADDAQPKTNKSSSTITFDVLLNADLSVVESDLGTTGTPSGEKTVAANEKISKALDVCGDLGVWVEWTARNQDRL